MSIDPMDHWGLMMRHLAKYVKYLNEGGERVQIEDLMGIGWEVLERACKTYRPEKGCRPSTHICAALRWQVHRRYLILSGRHEYDCRTPGVGRQKRSRIYLPRMREYKTEIDGRAVEGGYKRVDDAMDAESVLDILSHGLEDHEVQIAKMRVAGKSRADCAEKFGMTIEQVFKAHTRAMETFRRNAHEFGILAEAV